MKFLFLLLISASTTAQSVKCYVDKQIPKLHKKSEFIDMGGVSTLSEEQISDGKHKFGAIDTKEPKVRYSRHAYKECSIRIIAHSNDDTGNDKIEVYYDNIPLFTRNFSDNEYNFHLDLYEAKKIKFVVSNPNIMGKSPGAFQVSIWIKGLAMKF